MVDVMTNTNINQCKPEAKKLLMKTINDISEFAHVEEILMIKAVAMGLEGEKRRNRYDCIIDTQMRLFLETAAFDVLEYQLYPATVSSKNFDHITTPEKFFEEYKTCLWNYYTRITDAANKFVYPLCFKIYSEPLYARAECVMAEIIEVQRRLARGKRNGFGHDLEIYEQTWENVHDKYEKLEKSIGYKY